MEFSIKVEGGIKKFLLTKPSDDTLLYIPG